METFNITQNLNHTDYETAIADARAKSLDAQAKVKTAARNALAALNTEITFNLDPNPDVTAKAEAVKARKAAEAIFQAAHKEAVEARERSQELKLNNKITNRVTITTNDIMQEFNCSELEADAILRFDSETLEDARFEIARAVTYERLLKNLLPEALRYTRTEEYKGVDVSENFILDEARELVEDEAWQFAYEWEQIDDYSGMTDAEKRIAVYG